MSFEERKAVLKWYFKFENISEVQQQWRNEFGTQSQTRLTIARIRDKFEIDGTVGDVHKERSWRPRTARTLATSAVVLQQFTYNKMAFHPTTIEMSGCIWMKLYLDDG